MPDTTVRVVGGRRLRATMRRADVDLAEMKDAHQLVAAFVAAAARPRTPHDTGALAGTVRGNRAQSRATVSAGYGRLPYAGPIHWGWPARNIGAQPWLTDTAAATEPVWVQQYLDSVRRIIGRVEGA